MDEQPAGSGKLVAVLDRIPAAEAKPIPPEEVKHGIEVIEVPGWQADADSAPQDMVRVVDHDANQVLFFGTAAEHEALIQARHAE